MTKRKKQKRQPSPEVGRHDAGQLSLPFPELESEPLRLALTQRLAGMNEQEKQQWFARFEVALDAGVKACGDMPLGPERDVRILTWAIEEARGWKKAS